MLATETQSEVKRDRSRYTVCLMDKVSGRLLKRLATAGDWTAAAKIRDTFQKDPEVYDECAHTLEIEEQTFNLPGSRYIGKNGGTWEQGYISAAQQIEQWQMRDGDVLKEVVLYLNRFLKAPRDDFASGKMARFGEFLQSEVPDDPRFER